MGKVGYQRLGGLQMSGLGPTVVAVKWIVGVSGDELGGTGKIGPKIAPGVSKFNSKSTSRS